MRSLSIVCLFAFVAGCTAPGTDVESDADGASVPEAASGSWTVTGHLEPRGALDIRFTVAEPTECRLALFVQQVTDHGFSNDGHADLWVDGASVPIAFMGTAGYSNWDDRVKAGPVDSRLGQDTFMAVYSDAIYGEGAIFATGVGLRDVPVKVAGRMVLSAMGGLVDAPEAANVAIGGSMMASIECGSLVTLTVAEDAEAVWVHAAQIGGDAAVHTMAGGAEQGALDFRGDGPAIEALVGDWGGAQGELTFTGALAESIVFDGIPGDTGSEQWFTAEPGDVHVEWTTVRAYANWWLGLASWGPTTATVEAGGNYPF